MKDPDFQQLMGIVEVDETYHRRQGQEPALGQGRKRDAVTGTKAKVGVIGAISRKGNVVCQMIENTDTRDAGWLRPQDVSREKLELVATDEHPAMTLGMGGQDFGCRMNRDA